MSHEIIEYTAYLTFPPLAPQQVEEIRRAAQTSLGALDVDINSKSLEFDYSGRDADRKVVRFLAAVASTVGTAGGEVICSYQDEASEHPGDQIFEFYTVSGGQLYRQTGRIVRQTKEQVISDDADTLPPVEMVAA